MTSSSSLGSTSITLQFSLDRDIDAAARDVEAAINAARGYLPDKSARQSQLSQSESGRFADLHSRADFERTEQGPDVRRGVHHHGAKLSQIAGVGQVTVGGSALPGVRVELNPTSLNKYGISLETVRTVLSGANANVPKGHFFQGTRMWQIGANDQLLKAIDYEPLVDRLPQRRRRCESAMSARRSIPWKTSARQAT